MPGFDTRAIWGSDQGLRSNRFPYTGASVSPLDENLVDAFNRNFQQRFSLLQNVGESPNTKNIANFAWNQAIKEQQAPNLLKTTINPFEVSPFPRTSDVSFIDFSTPQPRQLQPGDLFSPGLTDLIKQPAKSISPPARRGGLDSFFSIKNTADRKKIFGDLVLPPTGFGFQNTASRNAFADLLNAANKAAAHAANFANNPQGNVNKGLQIPQGYKTLFQNLIVNPTKQTIQALKQTGTRAADTLFPERHTVPERLFDVIESPEFAKAVSARQTGGGTLYNSISSENVSAKEGRWLLDPRRTPAVGAGAFGSVVVPTNSQTAFKIQEGTSGLLDQGTKRFYENEVDMAIRTAELGYGPMVKSLTLQPTEKGLYRAVTRTEAVPHRKYSQLSEAEKQFMQREVYKLNENLIRGGILNTDSHFNNVLLNDATKKLVQVDSGLAKEYDPTDVNQLFHRLRNITGGLQQAGLPDVANETRELGTGLLQELKRNPSPEIYAEAENFFNRSGNILLKTPNEYPGFPAQSTAPTKKSLAQSLKTNVKPATKAFLLDAGINYALGASPQEAVVTAVTDPISAENLGGAPTAAIERLGPRGEFVDTRSNTVLNPQGRYTNQGIAYKNGKPVIVPRGSVAGEGNFATQAQAVLGNAINTWKKRLGALGMFGR